MNGTAGYSRALLVGITALVACTGHTTAARAQNPGFESPSLDQYIESVPTGGGPATAAPDARPERRQKVPSPTRRAIEAQGGADADALADIAGSPSLGAPAPAASPAAPKRTRRAGVPKPARDTRREAPTAAKLEPAAQGTLAAAGTALGGSGVVPLLLIASVVAGTMAMAAARLRSRRGG